MSAPDKNGWLPIETAPADKWIILYLPWNHTVIQGRWYTGARRITGWRICYGADRDMPVSGEPSHWQPLPEPPEAA